MITVYTDKGTGREVRLLQVVEFQAIVRMGLGSIQNGSLPAGLGPADVLMLIGKDLAFDVHPAPLRVPASSGGGLVGLAQDKYLREEVKDVPDLVWQRILGDKSDLLTGIAYLGAFLLPESQLARKMAWVAAATAEILSYGDLPVFSIGNRIDLGQAICEALDDFAS
jgi:hypothetical protein